MTKRKNKKEDKQKSPRTGKVRRVFTRDQLKGMLSFSIGAGKVAMLNEKRVKEGIQLWWEENGKIEFAIFPSKQEAKEFREAFAGKNLTTVRADEKYMHANGNWSAIELFEQGQMIIGIKLGIERVEALGRDNIILEPGTGRASITKRKRPPKKAETMPVPHFHVTKTNGTRYFDTPEECDKYFQNLYTGVPTCNKNILWLRTMHLESGAYVDWKRRSVKDGSSRMELVVRTINGQDYGFVAADIIFDVTEGFDVEPCQKLIEKPRAKEPTEICRTTVEANLKD